MQVSEIVQKNITSTKRKSINSGTAFVIGQETSELESKEVSATRVNVSSLWTLQEVDSYAADLEKMKQVGSGLLKELSEIRMGLISGELSKDNISKLNEAIKKSKIKLQFPDLQKVIDDIELRAEVELAKLEMNSENP